MVSTLLHLCREQPADPSADMQASQLKEADVEADAQAAPVGSTGATVAAADDFHAVRPPGFEIKARLAGIQVLLLLPIPKQL